MRSSIIVSLFFVVVLHITQLPAQQIVFEKSFRSIAGSFDPNDAVPDNHGNILVTGRYEAGTKYYHVVNDDYIPVDSTLPYGTHAFVARISPEGKLIDRTFLPALEGMSIAITREKEIFVTTFMNGYRMKNYTGDKTQGIMVFMLDSNLEIKWKKIYPSRYNSVPHRLLCTKDDGFLIAGLSLVSKDTTKWGMYDKDENRMLLIDHQGAVLIDTLLLTANFDTGLAAYYHRYEDPNAKNHKPLPPCQVTDIRETENGFLFCATSTETPLKWRILLFETDRNFHVLRSKKFETNRDTRADADEVLTYNFIPDSTGITLACNSHYSENNTMVVRIDNYFDTAWTCFLEGKSYDLPCISYWRNGKYVICNTTTDRKVQLNFMGPGKKYSQLITGQNETIELSNTLISGDFLYVIGECKGEEHYFMVMKVKLE